MFANGSSYSNGSNLNCSTGNALNGPSACSTAPRNTEPFYCQYLLGIQPGALL
jgi:hypothetical protein